MDLKYISTRGSKEEYTASMAVIRGLAEDGGLFVPNVIPKLDVPVSALV